MSLPWYNIPSNEYLDKKAVVIGGGLAGTSVAYSLANRGWQVQLIERNNQIASEASGNAAGIISPLISHKNDIIGKFFYEGFKCAVNRIKQLENLKYDLCGVFELSSSKVKKNISELVIDANYIEKVTCEEASEISFQQLKADVLHIKSGGWVSPVDLCSANINAFKDSVEVIYNTEAIKLERSSNKWSVVNKDGEAICCSDVVVIANANDAKNFEQTCWLPLIAVRGQVTHVESDDIKTKKVLCYDGGYVIPKIESINYVGATFDRKHIASNVLGEDDDVNILNLCSNLVNVAACDVVGARAAIRSTSPDRRPMIGAVANKEAFLQDYNDLKHGRINKSYPSGKYLKGLYVSTGFGSRGITGCPLAGDIIASMVNNEPLPIDKKIIDAVNPARFIIRQLKQANVF